MNTVDDIDRLHAAEKEAQNIIAGAKDAARRIRATTEARVRKRHDGMGDQLAEMRKKVQAEEEGETEKYVTASHARIAEASKKIAGQLEAKKAAAVKAVKEAVVDL